MQKFVPSEKLSKKEREKLNKARRSTWGALNPVTRRPENPKAYNRKKLQKGDDLRFEAFSFAIVNFWRGI